MAFKGQKVSVAANTVTALTTADVDQLPGQSITAGPCTVDLWFGDATVDTSGAAEGYKLSAGSVLQVDLDPREVLYVKSTATASVYVLHQGV